MAMSKTALGAQVMKDRSIALTPQQRSALILCDGKRDWDELLSLASAGGVHPSDVQKIFDLGLIAHSTAASDAQPTLPSALMPAQQSEEAEPTAQEAAQAQAQADFLQAHNAAITLCSDLGFKGFGLNMALTGVDDIQKLQKIAPEIRRAAGDAKYKPLHRLIFGQTL